ncbi:MAG TPA: polyprenyl synthetase family protein, partial [Candidatus Krumholzibacteria bacterium]|nr:polyprenyl synthetase family protein [Candidatus Krumholzibacteria bacterium]
GGKRLRPLLCLWTHDAFGGSRRDAALDCACALECVHTYSLVHDDLPCMDDDDLRRGKASSHRRFGEAMAVLAGDALLTLGFEITATIGERHALDGGLALGAVRILAAAAGTGGLITGQALDLAPPAGNDLATVQRIHEHKTGRLIAAAMEAGALLAGAEAAARARARRAGLEAGAAFQIVDDLLDLEGSQYSLGKTPGKDVHGGKLTFPAVAGVERSREEAARRIDAALAALPQAAGTPLASLFAHLVDRRS